MRTHQGLSLILFLCGLAHPAAAQRGGAGVITGLAGGASLSDFQDPDGKSRWGGTAGLFVGKASYRTVAQLEVNWIQKGGSSQTGANDTRLDYIEVPLTFGGVAQTGGGAQRGRFYGGISVAFKIGCSSTTATVCDLAKGTEWGAPIGLQLGKWSTSDKLVGVDVRYTLPLSRAFEGGAYNQTWQFRVVVGRSK